LKVWLDTADLKELERYRAVCSGVTTNPTILLKSGVTIDEVFVRIGKIAEMFPRCPISVEVTETDPEKMLVQAGHFRGKHENIVIKIPMSVTGLEVIKLLDKRNIDVNCTACMSAEQAYLASQAGAEYVSIFWNRVADACVDPIKVVNDSVEIMNPLPLKKEFSKLVVGSIRTIRDVTDIILKTNADIITVPTKFLDGIVNHPKTLEAIKQFDDDWSRLFKPREDSEK